MFHAPALRHAICEGLERDVGKQAALFKIETYETDRFSDPLVDLTHPPVYRTDNGKKGQVEKWQMTG